MLGLALFGIALVIAIASKVEASPAIVAQRQGRCAECRGAIYPGDPIVEYGAGVWLHEECEPMPDACSLGGTHRVVDGRCTKCEVETACPA